MGSDSRLNECFEIRLRVHTVFRGSGVYEWICLFIDVCVLCLSHSSGLVWPVCKHACTRVGTSLQGSLGNPNAGGEESLLWKAEAHGTPIKGKLNDGIYNYWTQKYV